MEALAITAATFILSIVTFWATEWRSARALESMAARDTVDQLRARVTDLVQEVQDLRERLQRCEEMRKDLTDRNMALMQQILNRGGSA